jgi:CBS domain-containing protein
MTAAALQREAPALQTCLREVMTRDVVCVGPDESAEAALRLLVEHGISGLPVVDAAGRPLGVLSRSDLLEERLEVLTEGELGEPARVRDLMTQAALSLPESASVAEAAALMASYGVHRVPVVSAEGVLVGVVSPLDLLRCLTGTPRAG